MKLLDAAAYLSWRLETGETGSLALFEGNKMCLPVPLSFTRLQIIYLFNLHKNSEIWTPTQTIQSRLQVSLKKVFITTVELNYIKLALFVVRAQCLPAILFLPLASQTTRGDYSLLSRQQLVGCIFHTVV